MNKNVKIRSCAFILVEKSRVMFSKNRHPDHFSISIIIFFYKCVSHNLKHVFIALCCPFQRHQNYVPSLCSCREKCLSFPPSRFFTSSKYHFLSFSSKFSHYAGSELHIKII